MEIMLAGWTEIIVLKLGQNMRQLGLNGVGEIFKFKIY